MQAGRRHHDGSDLHQLLRPDQLPGELRQRLFHHGRRLCAHKLPRHLHRAPVRLQRVRAHLRRHDLSGDHRRRGRGQRHCPAQDRRQRRDARHLRRQRQHGRRRHGVRRGQSARRAGVHHDERHDQRARPHHYHLRRHRQRHQHVPDRRRRQRRQLRRPGVQHLRSGHRHRDREIQLLRRGGSGLRHPGQ